MAHQTSALDNIQVGNTADMLHIYPHRDVLRKVCQRTTPVTSPITSAADNLQHAHVTPFAMFLASGPLQLRI